MFGTRVVAEKAQELFAESTRSISTANNSVPGQFIQRLCQQGKLISQITAYIWKWAEEDINQYPEQVSTALSLREYFIYPQEPKGNLTNLLSADPRGLLETPEAERVNRPRSKEEQLLVNVFGASRVMQGEDFPILDQVEADMYELVVDVNAFQGTLADPDLNTQRFFIKFTIPFPPAPKLGKATVTAEELNDWINNQNPNQFVAANPYIPTTCS